MELNIGTFATVLARHSAPASESAKPLLADGCLPSQVPQPLLLVLPSQLGNLTSACHTTRDSWLLVSNLFGAFFWLVAWFWLAKFVDFGCLLIIQICLTMTKLFRGYNSDVSPDSQSQSRWKSIYFQIHVASTVVAWFALDSNWADPFEQSSSLNMSTIRKAFCTGFTCAQSDSNRDLN